MTLVVPWRPSGRDRQRALDWILQRHREERPDLPVVVVEHDGEPWCKAATIREAAAATDGLLIVSDADVWCDRLDDAVEAVQAGAPWAVPHDRVHRLTREATGQLITVGGNPAVMPCHRRRYRGVAAGGIIVIPAATVRDVPPDVRFTGWGGEDFAWRDALRTLVGPEWRDTTGPLIHLWHPAQPDKARHVGSNANRRLMRRYIFARDQPVVMRALIEETRCPSLSPPANPTTLTT